MKILLLGDFSALHKNLKEGLEALNHEVVLASHGDHWKKIENDIDLNYKSKFLPHNISSRIFPLLDINSLTGFDIIQIINPFFMYRKYFPTKQYLEYICKRNKKSFILGAGDDAFFWQIARKKMKYGPFDDYLKYDLKVEKFFLETQKTMQYNKDILDIVDGLIPIMYEYEVGYKSEYDKPNKIKKVIPIPINTDKIEYHPNKVKDKIVIFHGLNRYGFKGTKYVEEAFEILNKKYPNDLELVIKGNMPLNDYLKLMQRTNIVIDQTNSYSLGVNGVYALAMGKIVLGGAEKESLDSLGVNKSPIINIKPSAKSIIEEIEKILENRDNIESLGYKSRIFAKNVHNYKIVAQRYIDTWQGKR